MKILAIETSMGRTSVALATGGSSDPCLTKQLPASQSQAEGLIPLIGELMSEGHIDFSALDRVAVCVGPGGFSGIRTGVAAARGIGLAANIPVVGVTSFNLLAAAFRKTMPTYPAKTFGIVAAAGSNMVFCQIVEPESPMSQLILTVPRLDVGDFFAHKLAFLAGPCASSLIEAGLVSRCVEAVDLAPDAAILLEVARDLDPNLYPPSPYYARPADAKPQEGYAVDRKPE